MVDLKSASIDLMNDFLVALCNAAATVHLLPLEERMHRFGGPQWGSVGVSSPMMLPKTMTRARAGEWRAWQVFMHSGTQPCARARSRGGGEAKAGVPSEDDDVRAHAARYAGGE